MTLDKVKKNKGTRAVDVSLEGRSLCAYRWTFFHFSFFVGHSHGSAYVTRVRFHYRRPQLTAVLLFCSITEAARNQVLSRVPFACAFDKISDLAAADWQLSADLSAISALWAAIRAPTLAPIESHSQDFR